jgi:hypothetical protein
VAAGGAVPSRNSGARRIHAGRAGGDALRRQHRLRRIAPEDAVRRRLADLLAHQVFVALRGEIAAVGARAQHRRLDEDHQVRLLAPARIVPKCGAEHGNVAEQRHLVAAVGQPILDETAEHDDLRVVDDDGRFERAFRQHDARRDGDVLDARHFLIQGKAYGPALGDLRLDAKHDADVLALERLERRHRGRPSGGRVAAGDELDVLPDDDPRFLVVECEERRRREDVRADLRLERAREKGEIGDGPEARNRDGAFHDAERQSLADVPRIDGDVDDVVPAAARREVRAADDPRLRRVVAGQRLPLDAEFGRLVRRHLDDQRFDVDLGAANVELLDDGAEIVVDGLGRHDDERVARDVGGDGCAVRRERRRRRRRCRRERRGGRRRRHGAGHRRVAEEQRWRRRRRRRRGGAAVASAQHRPERLRDARRLRVPEIHDVHVAAGPSRRVELLDQLPHAREAAGIVGTHEHAVRPRVGEHGHALLGVDGSCRAGGLREQPVEQRDDVDRGCVAERHQDRLRAGGGLVERRDDPVDAAEVVRVIGDDERVARGEGRDRVVRRDQWTQHVDELGGRFVAQRDHLRHQPVAAARDRSYGDGASLLLRVGLRHDFRYALAFDDGEALEAERRQQRRIHEALRHGTRRDDVDRSLHPGVDQEVPAGDLGDRLHDGFDVGVDEIEGDGVVSGRESGRRGRPCRQKARTETRRGRAGRGTAGALRRSGAPVYRDS